MIIPPTGFDARLRRGAIEQPFGSGAWVHETGDTRERPGFEPHAGSPSPRAPSNPDFSADRARSDRQAIQPITAGKEKTTTTLSTEVTQALGFSARFDELTSELLAGCSPDLRFEGFLTRLDWETGHTKHEQCHQAFLRAASLGIAPAEAIAMVVTRVERVGGTINPRDIDRQQQRAYAYVTNEPIAGGKTCGATPGHTGGAKRPRRTSPPPAKSVFTPEVLERVAGQAGDLGMCPRTFLGLRSPVDQVGLKSFEVLPHLYRPGEKVLVFTNQQSQGQVLHPIGIPEESGAVLPDGGPDGVWMLSNPVDGNFHPNPRQDRKLSRRSEEAVTSWRYLLIESDRVTPDQWIRVIIQMPLPIAAIYSSGGDSVHSLVRVDAATKAEWDCRRDAVKSVLITLGACPGSLSAVRLTRLPQAFRESKGRRQELLFLDPQPAPRPILGRPALRAPNPYPANNGLLIPAAYAH